MPVLAAALRLVVFGVLVAVARARAACSCTNAIGLPWSDGGSMVARWPTPPGWLVVPHFFRATGVFTVVI